MKKAKIIEAFSFKSVTKSGNLAKIYTVVYADGVSTISTVVLCDAKQNHESIGFQKITTRFGKTLWVSTAAYKLNTLITITEGVLEALRDAKVDPKDIER